MGTDDLRMYVKPVSGRAVCIPERGFALLPEEGMEVQRNTFWNRRIAAGDVVIVEVSSKTVKAQKEGAEK